MIRIDQLIATATRIRFPNGAFGKTCMVITVVAAAFSMIAWSVHDQWVSALALILLAAITHITLQRLFDFADKNPAAAILEGAEFIRHEQMQITAKNMPVLPTGGTTAVSEPECLPLLPDTPDSPGVLTPVLSDTNQLKTEEGEARQ